MHSCRSCSNCIARGATLRVWEAETLLQAPGLSLAKVPAERRPGRGGPWWRHPVQQGASGDGVPPSPSVVAGVKAPAEGRASSQTRGNRTLQQWNRFDRADTTGLPKLEKTRQTTRNAAPFASRQQQHGRAPGKPPCELIFCHAEPCFACPAESQGRPMPTHILAQFR